MKKNNLKIIPTLFSKNVNEFKSKFEKVKNLSNLFHIDIMDGKFTNSKSVDLKKLDFIKNFKKDFEVHLMCYNPEKYLDICLKLKVKKVYFHFEIFEEISQILSFIEKIKSNKKYKFELGIAVNPKTEFEEIMPILNNIENVMFMGVIPGVQGQVFIREIYQKVRRTHDFNSKLNIQIDGGIKVDEIRRLVHNGGKSFCVGSYLNSSEFPVENYNLLKSSMELGEQEQKHTIHISEPYSKITNYIYLGPNRCCRMFSFDKKLLDLGVKAEINLEEFGSSGTLGVDLYLWIPTKDHMSPNQTQLISAVKTMDSLVKNKTKMYVHCELGHTRSPTLVVAYLIYIGKSLDDAILFVKKKRYTINITKNQIEGLKKFEKSLKK